MVVGGRELIDTLWNVNGLRQQQCRTNTELIDTLWNVNDISHHHPVKDWKN